MINSAMRFAMLFVVGIVAFGATSGSASAQQQHTFLFADHSEGRTVLVPTGDLLVTLEIRRAGLSIAGNERSEICATFENPGGSEWKGGYRLTDRDVNDTHASIRIPAYESEVRCETLNPQMIYYVVLRRDW
ncbi:hypothetical protein [Silanimonas sp.]|uniref:hypothetical protein n=1 Tax=Silanimonas sp. TaxID=1929290 RepID=UPI0022C993FA|nr:hypothetical protein [Silanimonas sp.]MCZ8063974.1 hypothetical protein [Silanimonas sp.]